MSQEEKKKLAEKRREGLGWAYHGPGGMETPPSECYSSCQLHACRTTGKNTQYKFHQRNNAAPGSKNIPRWQSMEHDPHHFNTYCTPPGWRTKATAALGMLSCTVFILTHKYSGCTNAHMWILGVKFRHRDYCYKSWSLKPLHRTWSSSLLHENVLKKDLFVAHSFSGSRCCDLVPELRKSR